jgi:hypothetical protein
MPFPGFTAKGAPQPEGRMPFHARFRASFDDEFEKSEVSINHRVAKSSARIA